MQIYFTNLVRTNHFNIESTRDKTTITVGNFTTSYEFPYDADIKIDNAYIRVVQSWTAGYSSNKYRVAFVSQWSLEFVVTGSFDGQEVNETTELFSCSPRTSNCSADDVMKKFYEVTGYTEDQSLPKKSKALIAFKALYNLVTKSKFKNASYKSWSTEYERIVTPYQKKYPLTINHCEFTGQDKNNLFMHGEFDILSDWLHNSFFISVQQMKGTHGEFEVYSTTNTGITRFKQALSK